MRWVSYRSAGEERAGLVLDGNVHGIAPGVTLTGLVAGGHDALQAAGNRATSAPSEVLGLDDVSLAPVVRPTVIRDFSAFFGHMKNAMKVDDVDEAYKRVPAFYFSNPAGVLGAHDDVAISPGSRMFDFELEIGAVIGGTWTNVPPAEAEQAIVGYTIFSDWSARDVQAVEMPLYFGAVKSKDSANTLGPFLVTADELEPLRRGKGFDLEMRAYVNDELVGKGSLAELDWAFADLVSYAARGTTLLPGDIIGSGTVPTGCLFEHFAVAPEGFRGWLQTGDVVTLSVEQLGEVRQRVVEPLPLHPLSTGF